MPLSKIQQRIQMITRRLLDQKLPV